MPRRRSSSTIGWCTAARDLRARSASIAGHRRVAPHSAGVRPLVAVEDALVVLRRRERHRALAVAQREQRQLLALQELLQHDLGLAEALLGEEHVHRLARLALVLGDDHALARGEHVGLEHRRVDAHARWAIASSRSRKSRATPWARRSPASAPWRTPSSPRSARPRAWGRTRRCRPRSGRPRGPPRVAPRAPPPRGRTPRSRAASTPRRRGEALDPVAGDAGVARAWPAPPARRRRAEARDERVLAATRADDEDASSAQSAEMKSSTGIAERVS